MATPSIKPMFRSVNVLKTIIENPEALRMIPPSRLITIAFAQGLGMDTSHCDGESTLLRDSVASFEIPNDATHPDYPAKATFLIEYLEKDGDFSLADSWDSLVPAYCSPSDRWPLSDNIRPHLHGAIREYIGTIHAAFPADNPPDIGKWLSDTETFLDDAFSVMSVDSKFTYRGLMDVAAICLLLCNAKACNDLDNHGNVRDLSFYEFEKMANDATQWDPTDMKRLLTVPTDSSTNLVPVRLRDLPVGDDFVDE